MSPILCTADLGLLTAFQDIPGEPQWAPAMVLVAAALERPTAALTPLHHVVGGPA